MCESQVSCAVNLGPTAGANASSNIATSNVSQLMKQLEEYLLGRLDEIENKVKNNSRSIFDFVDMAVLIGALANATDSQNKRDTPQYIDFVKSELLPSTETQSDVIATVFYCLMRCGLIHEMSLAQHNIPPSRQQIISGWSANVTHDKSTCGHWYQADGATKSVVFYANELLCAIRNCIKKSFDGTSVLWSAIYNKISSGSGIKIVGVIQCDK